MVPNNHSEGNVATPGQTRAICLSGSWLPATAARQRQVTCRPAGAYQAAWQRERYTIDHRVGDFGQGHPSYLRLPCFYAVRRFYRLLQDQRGLTGKRPIKRREVRAQVREADQQHEHIPLSQKSQSSDSLRPHSRHVALNFASLQSGHSGSSYKSTERCLQSSVKLVAKVSRCKFNSAGT